MKKHYKMLFVLFLLSTQLVSAQRNGRMLFSARLTGAKEVPAVNTIAKGLITAVIVGNEVTINAVFDSLSGPVTACHFHKGSSTTTGSSITNYVSSVRGNRLYLKTTLTNAQIADMIEDSIYFNVHTALNGSGEIRGQMLLQSDLLFDAFANGAQEVPAVTTTASAIGSFVRTLFRTSANNRVEYKVVANGLSGPITSAHLHYGEFGTSGRVAYPLTINGNVLTGTLVTTVGFADSLAAGLIYLNIHTAANPSGEIRGQIFYEGDGIGFDGLIEGTQEVPAVTSTAKGAMYVNIRSTLDTLDYGIQINGLTPTLAHFHNGAAGTNGSPLFNLTPTAFSNLYSGKIAVTPAILAAMIRDSFYANFHTAANPGGEIRGQVLSVLRTGLVSNLCGGQEAPAVTTNASGAGYVSLSRDKSNIFLDVVTNGLSSNATVAHIHTGAKGVNGGVAVDLTAALVGNSITGVINNVGAVLADTTLKSATYFNFHTTANAGGEIRGQIAPDLVQECLANATLELNGEKFAVKVAPNPVSSLLNISFDSNEQLNAQIVITDLAGRQIATQKAQILRGSNNIDVNVANWNNGIYFIQMRQANRLLFTEKVVKN